MVVRFILEVPRVISDEERKVLKNLAQVCKIIAVRLNKLLLLLPVVVIGLFTCVQVEQGNLTTRKVNFLQFMCDWDAETRL